MTWIQTYTGRKFDLLDPQPDMIALEDIAHHLSMQCRFNGACREFYSVAQHSVHVAELLPPELQAHGLLHDAAEAYIGDMVRPLKRLLPTFADVERNILAAIGRRFEIGLLSVAKLAAVKAADNTMLATEARDLMADSPDDWGLTAEPRESVVIPWTSNGASLIFLATAWQLGIR